MIYALFVFTVALAAVLTFSIQPLMGKLFLPVMGGTPAVWNTAMVFFQTALLAGYLYVHWTVRWLGPSRQWLLHCLLLLLALWFQPVSVETPDASVLDERPALWVLATLVTTVGLPFVLVTATTPLVQRWLAATAHPRAGDPYHLYASSNCGSVGALLAYPLLLEPRLGLSGQSDAWSLLYLVLCLCLWAGGLLMVRSSTGAVIDRGACADQPGPGWRERVQWMVYAFIPSSLMLAVTSVITTDLAPMPLLWVLPLALYLVSHIHAFSRHRPVATAVWFRLVPILLIPSAFSLAIDLHEPMLVLIALHLAVLAVIALAFHGRLADRRPAPAFLTEYYVWLALGGAAGGVFNALLAPMAFDRLLEYPLVLLLAVIMTGRAVWCNPWARAALGLGLALCLGFGLSAMAALLEPESRALVGWLIGTIAACALIGLLLRRALPSWGLAQVVCGVALVSIVAGDTDEIDARRSFYGTHRVLSAEDGRYRVLVHGNTAHGIQERDRGGPPRALGYYHADGPVGDIFDVVRDRAPHGDVAVIGLGSGAMAAHRGPYQRMVFFEIDSTVERIASDPEYFTFLERCTTGCAIRRGDGRLRMADEPDRRFDLIVLDAYSSAAIPVHLLTREALRIFADKLAADGILAFHVSNPWVDLAPVVARLAREHDLVLRQRAHYVDPGMEDVTRIHDSEWIVLARRPNALGPIARKPEWRSVAPYTGRVWTDDFTPVWQVYAGLFD